GWRPTQALSLVALAAGLSTALLWRYLGWHAVAYEGLPGILVGLGVLMLATRREPQARATR
ncbi:MAG: sodium/proline symporter, partial [Halioglobus sp.]|nr:sodium/proline symporter [Halioglobus sp.]